MSSQVLGFILAFGGFILTLLDGTFSVPNGLSGPFGELSQLDLDTPKRAQCPMAESSKSSAQPRSAGAEQLLDAAIELIAQHGYAGMSVDALCRKAGIVKSGLYWHFGSKEGLLWAVVDRVTNEWIQNVRDSAYQGGDAMERLDRTLAAMQRRITESPDGLRVLLVVLLERGSVDPEFAAILRNLTSRVQTTLAQGIRDALGTDVPDLDVVASIMLAMFHGVFLRHLARQDPNELAVLFQGMREALMLLIAQRLPAECREKFEVQRPGGRAPGAPHGAGEGLPDEFPSAQISAGPSARASAGKSP
jgi:AcrR family transcriptional regulator